MTRSMGTQWYREDYRGNEDALETREQFENRRGLDSGTMNSRFYDYANQRPEPAKAEGRTLFYVRSELDSFYDGIQNRSRPRTPAEKMESEIVRVQTTVKDHEARVERLEKETDKARRALEAKRVRLEKLRKYHEIVVSTTLH